MTDTVLITNEAGEYTYVCPNVHFIFGYTADEIHEQETIDDLLGKNLFDRDELAKKGVLKNIETTAIDKAGRGTHSWSTFAKSRFRAEHFSLVAEISRNGSNARRHSQRSTRPPAISSTLEHTGDCPAHRRRHTRCARSRCECRLSLRC